MSKATIYEHPLSERIRTLLRLEHLFRQAHHYNCEGSFWDSRIFIASLFELLDLFSRADLKTEIMKEIDRASGNLRVLLENPNIDTDRLNTILKALDHINRNLLTLSGQLGQKLRDDPFLSTIRQRSTIPGGTCDFDLPGYHYWLSLDSKVRLQRQQGWLEEIEPIKQAVDLILKLIRNSAEPKPMTTVKGQYSQALETHYPYQLLRLFIPHEAGYYAETSGSKHRFTLRFLTSEGDGDIVKPVDGDVGFDLAICML